MHTHRCSGRWGVSTQAPPRQRPSPEIALWTETHPKPWTDWLTHASENITFFAVGKNSIMKLQIFTLKKQDPQRECMSAHQKGHTFWGPSVGPKHPLCRLVSLVQYH